MLNTVAQLAATCTTTSNGTSTCAVGAAFSGILIVFLLFYLAMFAAMIVAWVKIVTKAGYSGWYVLVAFVPIVGVVFFFIFAFADWPVLQQLRSSRAAYVGGFGGYGQSWAQPAYAMAPPAAGAPGPWAPPTSTPTATTGTAPGPGPFQPPEQPLPKFYGSSTTPTPQGPAMPTEPQAPQGAIPPGWYPTDGGERYWDGSRWTDHTR
jgi:hypothetical protein